MPHFIGRSVLLRALVLGSLVALTGGCLGPTTIVISAPKPTDLVRVQGTDQVGVSLRVLDARPSDNHLDSSRVVGHKPTMFGAPGGAAISNDEPIPALIERSVKDQLSALGYQVRDTGPARLTIEVWRFEQRFPNGTVTGSSEADIYLSITASNASGADCLWDFVNIRVHEDVTTVPGGTAQASLEKALGLAMKYLAEKVALHDALMRAASTNGTSSC
jgi:uncharacterized lipoprotein YajG